MRVRRWEPAELDLTGTGAASVTFRHGEVRAVVATFRSGDRLLARYAPDRTGRWWYAIMDGSGAELGTGALDCEPEPPDDHGPVGPSGTRFRHADGTAHVPLQSTALWWHRQPSSTVELTLAGLRDSPITAVRTSVLPPDSAGWPGDDELELVERAVVALGAIDRQAELVIFGDGTALLRDGWTEHLRNVVARFAGFRNVAWCLAIDADRSGVQPARWDEALRLLAEHDHGHRPTTVHAGPGFDFGDRRLGLSSVRTDHARSSSNLNDDFAKPAVLDGVPEGDAPVRETDPVPECAVAEDVVLQAWETAVRGGYPSHGEWFVDDDHEPWRLAGGELRGESLPRLAFLRQVLSDVPGEPRYLRLRPDASTLGIEGEYYLQYLGEHRFRSRSFELPDASYRVEVIDTWTMTAEEVQRTDAGSFTVDLPGRLYQAVRITRC